MSIDEQIVLYEKLAVAYQRTIDSDSNTGLCKACETMFLPYYADQERYKYDFGRLTQEEFSFLSEDLRVESSRRHDAKEMFDAFYWYEHQDTQSRINYVNNKINELKT